MAARRRKSPSPSKYRQTTLFEAFGVKKPSAPKKPNVRSVSCVSVESKEPEESSSDHAWRVRHNHDHRRFEIRVDDRRTAFLKYVPGNNDQVVWLDLVQTVVPRSLRGQGLARELCGAAFEFARDRGYRVIPSCSYISKRFLPRHAAFASLVFAPSAPGVVNAAHNKPIKRPPRTQLRLPHQSKHWHAQEALLAQRLPDCAALKECMAKLGGLNATTLDGLERSINAWPQPEQKTFFTHTLPFLQCTARSLPRVFANTSLPLLKRGVSATVVVTRPQAAALLACGFFCLHPPSPMGYPRRNWNGLFSKKDASVNAKLRCLLHFFHQLREKATPTAGDLTITRTVAECDASMLSAQLATTTTELGSLRVEQSGSVEDAPELWLRADFANASLGGGVLGRGAVQEEIMFVEHPELLTALFLCERMADDEAIAVQGAERFSKHFGYGSSFRFDGAVHDTPTAAAKRVVLCFDALAFRSTTEQYRQFEPRHVLREIRKAHTAFSIGLGTPHAGVATGNWGCGVFGGDVQLKALLQWMAATVTQRPVLYYSFGNAAVSQFVEVVRTLQERRTTVAELWELIAAFGRQTVPSRRHHALFDFVLDSFAPVAPREEDCEWGVAMSD